MTPDPPVRVDGLCACGCGRPVILKRQRYVPEQLLAGEPFASTECCKAYHGIDFGMPGDRGRPRARAFAA